METCPDLPELTLNLKDSQEDVYKLLTAIKPAWKKEEVKIQVLSGGCSCSTLRCYKDDENSVTLCVRQQNAETTGDLLLEQQVVNALASKDLFPPVLATFKNGFCYEYVPGKPIVTKESAEICIDEEQLRLIARQMADVHAMKIPDLDYTETDYFDLFVYMIGMPSPEFEGCPTMAELHHEVRLVQGFVSSVDSPFVLSHCNCHPGNLVWNEAQRKITFVDWEMAQVAPRALDIACFFVTCENFGFAYQIPTSMPNDAERQLCHHYLQRTKELQDDTSSREVTEEELAQLISEVKYFTLVVKLAWVIFNTKKYDALNKKFAVDFQRMWDYNYGRYLRNKEELMGIKKLGQPVEIAQNAPTQEQETS